MTKLNIQGIVTQVVPFSNYDAILTLFTPEEGLVKFFHKGAYSKKKQGGGATPLAVVEATYAKGRGDMHPCSDLCVLDHHLGLRGRLATLETACDLLQTVMATQQPGKGAPDLYRLLLIYLNRLSTCTAPHTLAASFRLKLLRYEGLFAFLSHCSSCAAELREAWVFQSEAYCRAHTPPEALSFTEEERGIVELLTFGRDINQLASLEITGILSNKVNRLFKDSLR